MKNITLSFCLFFAFIIVHAQNDDAVASINQLITPSAALAPLRFLAADELMGRGTSRPEINIAARYISEQFRSFGLKEAPGANDYFQTFTITMKKPATGGSLAVNGSTYNMLQTLLQITGGDTTITAPVMYVKHGTENDLKNTDIKGKIVITELGDNDSASFRQSYYSLKEKQQRLQERGAAAMIELYKEGDAPWAALQRFLSGETAMEEAESGIPVLIVKDDAGALKKAPGVGGTLTVQGTQLQTIPAKNVIGIAEGADPKLKDQYIVLTAHYDHLGVAKQPKMEEGKMDSIFNGARDNAAGVAAVMDAAQYFAHYPPKRSVLFIAYAAEEIGELGSKYFSEHPLIPLKQLVYNLNIDNASYNDTSIITVVGLGRTSADNDIKKGVAAFGLKAMPDPAPEQNLFDRSDNANLAVHGIPAPTYSLGFTKFDAEIFKRYHQLSDEAGNFDMSYGIKYIRAFILAAKLIADNPKQPEWIKGDKYEAAWKQLYR